MSSELTTSFDGQCEEPVFAGSVGLAAFLNDQ